MLFYYEYILKLVLTVNTFHAYIHTMHNDILNSKVTQSIFLSIKLSKLNQGTDFNEIRRRYALDLEEIHISLFTVINNLTRDEPLIKAS